MIIRLGGCRQRVETGDIGKREVRTTIEQTMEAAQLYHIIVYVSYFFYMEICLLFCFHVFLYLFIKNYPVDIFLTSRKSKSSER